MKISNTHHVTKNGKVKKNPSHITISDIRNRIIYWIRRNRTDRDFSESIVEEFFFTKRKPQQVENYLESDVRSDLDVANYILGVRK